MSPPLLNSRPSFALHAMEHGCFCPFFVHPLCQMEVATACSCVSFKSHSFSGSDFEVMNVQDIKKKEVNK
jgi:hypothetical protein